MRSPYRGMFLAVVVFGLSLPGISSLHAADLEIQVAVNTGDGPATHSNGTRERPSSSQSAQRRVFHVGHSQPVHVHWLARNNSKDQPLTDVLLHFFIVKETMLGEDKRPKQGENVVYEGALTMDFKANDQAVWDFSLQLRDPGNYLLEVETLGLVANQGHEFFAALDLAVD